MSGDPGTDPFEGISTYVLNPEDMRDCGLLRYPSKIPDLFRKFDLRCPSLRKRVSQEKEKEQDNPIPYSHTTS